MRRVEAWGRQGGWRLREGEEGGGLVKGRRVET